MSITLQFNAEVERKLQEEAARNGLTVEAYVQRLVEQSIPTSQAPPPLTAEEWVAKWEAWGASHERLPHIADDSRESIYAGCGE